MAPSDPTTTPPAPWIPFLGPALRLRRNALGLRGVDVSQRVLAQGGCAVNIYRYEGAILSTTFGLVACGAPFVDVGIEMMVRLTATLDWSVVEWLAAAEDLRRKHEKALARAMAEQGLTPQGLLDAYKAGQWRSQT